MTKARLLQEVEPTLQGSLLAIIILRAVLEGQRRQVDSVAATLTSY